MLCRGSRGSTRAKPVYTSHYFVRCTPRIRKKAIVCQIHGAGGSLVVRLLPVVGLPHASWEKSVLRDDARVAFPFRKLAMPRHCDKKRCVEGVQIPCPLRECKPIMRYVCAFQEQTHYVRYHCAFLFHRCRRHQHLLCFQLLPPRLRAQWKHIADAFDLPLTCSVEDALPKETDIPSTIDDFRELAAAPTDTKCGICRSSLHPEEIRDLSITHFTAITTLLNHRVRAAELAEGWDTPNYSPFQYMVWTRVRASDSMIPAIQVCEYCHSNPTMKHFLSPLWPEDIIYGTDGTSFALPSANNLGHLNPVRFQDTTCRATRVRVSQKGSSNIVYRTMRWNKDSEGSSTQLVSFKPHPADAHRYVSADSADRVHLQTFLTTNRTDLHDFFHNQKLESCDCHSTPISVTAGEGTPYRPCLLGTALWILEGAALKAHSSIPAL